MSRTKKANDYIKGWNGTNIHHCINKSSGGRDCSDNMVELKIRIHNAIHEIFWNQMPHEIIETLLDTICKPFTDEFKKALFNVLSDYKWKEYKPNTYHWSRPKHWPNDWQL